MLLWWFGQLKIKIAEVASKNPGQSEKESFFDLQWLHQVLSSGLEGSTIGMIFISYHMDSRSAAFE